MKKRKPLHELPKAKGRPRGKRCTTCEKTKPYQSFKPTKSLVCAQCKSSSLRARGPYECTCIFCNDLFEARSPLATCCTKDECRATRTAAYRLEHRSRRRAQRKSRNK